jgi:opacity protein-like surface antigen
MECTVRKVAATSKGLQKCCKVKQNDWQSLSSYISDSKMKSFTRALTCMTIALAPIAPISAEQASEMGVTPPHRQETESLSVEEQARKKIIELEAELIILKRSLGMDRQNKKILVPKSGIYLQGDIGIQQREFAGENGITNLKFDPGFYGGAGLGYRYDRNFRFSFEYSQMNNAVSKIRPGIPIPVVDPIVGPVGADGAQFDANGTVRLDSYTLNAYYDLNGFGYEKRFRPYIGAGVGLMTSKINGLQPSFFPSIGANRALNAQDTQPTFNVQAGISYLFNKNTEFYVGGQYSYTSTFLFENTDFGTLMPNGARNWTLKTGMRYTF